MAAIIHLIPGLAAALVAACFRDGEVLVLVDAHQSASRVLDPLEHDPLALVRVGLQQLIGGRPAGMLGRGMPLQLPGADEPAAAAVDRTAPLLPGLTRVVEAEQRVAPVDPGK
jgi:hypothetical protein